MTFLECWVYFVAFILFFDGKILLANNVALGLGLHCLPMTLLQISS